MKQCEHCFHYHFWEEKRPYGSTFALEPFNECELFESHSNAELIQLASIKGSLLTMKDVEDLYNGFPGVAENCPFYEGS